MKTREQTGAFLAMVWKMPLEEAALTYCTLVNAITCCKEPGSWSLALCTAIDATCKSIHGKATWEEAVNKAGEGF